MRGPEPGRARKQQCVTDCNSQARGVDNPGRRGHTAFIATNPETEMQMRIDITVGARLTRVEYSAECGDTPWVVSEWDYQNHQWVDIDYYPSLADALTAAGAVE